MDERVSQPERKRPAIVTLMESTEGPLRKRIAMQPAWAFVAPANHHGAELLFELIHVEEHCGVFWRLMTSWYLPQSTAAWKARGLPQPDIFDGLGDVGWHTPIPLSEWAHQASQECEITGGECWGSSSSTASQELFHKAIARPEAIWETLSRNLEQLRREIAQELEERNH